MRPGAGAFAPPPAEPQAATKPTQPDVQDPAVLLQRLQSLGLVGAPRQAPAPKAPGTERGHLPTQSVPDPIAQLSSMTGQPKGDGTRGTTGTLSTPATPAAPPRPTKKAKFVPGQPGAPKSGMTAHQMMRDPDTVADLQAKVAAWEAENPKRKLMGPHLQAMLPNVSPAQARTLLRLMNRMAAKETDLAERYQRGAYNAMRG